MATILITGGTGLIGKALVKALREKDHDIIILTRKIPDTPSVPGVSYALWDIQAQTIDMQAIAKADHIIHLAGAGVVEKRWFQKRKQEIVNSRVKSGELLVNAMRDNPNHIRTVISSSAIGWYGPDPIVPNPSPFTEDMPAYNDFLGQTCLQWEKSLEPVVSAGKRLVKIRTGIVLSAEGGALKEFTRPIKFGIAAILGNGKQVLSWIHIDDVVRIYIMAIENEHLSGAYNAVAPRPVTNKELVLEIARVRKGKFYVPIHVPAFILKLVLGEMSIEILKSATISAEKIKKAGFVFQYPALSGLAQLFKY